MQQQDAKNITGTSDVVYNLASVIYHELQEAETVQQYIQDAQQAGDQQLVQFFQQVQQGARKQADQAKQLLKQKLNQG